MKGCRAYVLACAFLFSGFHAFGRPMTATLNLTEKVSLQELAENVLDPNSDRYGVYYTPEEIKKMVAPDDEAYNRMLTELKYEGFSIVFESKSHLVLTIKGDHTDFERVFKTHILFTKSLIHKNLESASIPENLSIVRSISGLNNVRKFKPRYKIFPHLEEFSEQPGILPDDIKATYGIAPLYDRGLTGEGQHIGVATYMNYEIEDIKQYFQKIEISPVPQVDTVEFNGKAVYESRSAMETELDVQMAGTIAPGAKIHVFTSAENSEAGELALFTAVLDDNRAKVVNYSWGSCETYVNEDHRPDMDRVFFRAVAQGVSLLVASGDNGSDGCGDGTVVADWPAAHPGVVAVGGTAIYLNADKTKRERGWSGSGGGLSSHYPLPSWQEGFKAPFVKRSFPDIAFNGDPSTGQGIWVRSSKNGTPQWEQVGGTSMSAPQWVGYLALVNEARAERGLRPLGFLNPILYGASQLEKARIFTDVTAGKNGKYSAGRGWDAVTGWGSMKGAEMLDFLLNR